MRKSDKPRPRLTLDELRSMETEVLTPDMVARATECDPQYIRVAAREEPELLGYPVILVGNRVKIPRRAFIRWMEGHA